VKPFYLSSETVLPIKPFYLSNSACTATKWRNELVAYREKSPAEFLAEVLSLVRDMDNDVEVELIDAGLATQRVGGGSRVAAGEELQLCEEWTHNPTLAMARPDRLCRLANKTRSTAQAAGGAGAGGSAGAASLAAAGARVGGGGVSGVEVNVATPKVAAKRREALGAVDVNAAAADQSQQPQQPQKQLPQQQSSSPPPAASSLLEPHYVVFDSPSLTSPRKLVRSALDDGLVAFDAGDVENAAPGRAGGAALKAGFSAKAAVDLSAVFGAATVGLYSC
jgi:hypothetical protein